MSTTTITVGDKVPSVKIKIAGESGGGEETSTNTFFANKRVVVFGVPGAFTPTCSAKHLPGFVEKAEELRAKGADVVACVSVNDAFVMGAWGRENKAFGKVVFLADGNADFVRALGLELDLTANVMGVRSKRFLAVFDNGVCTSVDVEQPGKFEVSSAEAALKRL
ncbi:MAG: peroxiredoxin [Polyangiaceae bacterium]|nr:peroxiredoxin [Polyangiaceae bacterium]